MLPCHALLVLIYLRFSQHRLTESKLGLAILHNILQLPFSVYLMRNSFEGIPKEMAEAAVVNGAGFLFAVRRIFLPLVMSGMVTVAFAAFITSWNEFLGALILMKKETTFTVPIMMTEVITSQFGSVNRSGLLASVIVSILPCLIVYPLLQRHYISCPLSGAVK